MDKPCDLLKIVGGPKLKFYCNTCKKLFDEVNPVCPKLKEHDENNK